jgi:energy-coupling factor transport system permease protein
VIFHILHMADSLMSYEPSDRFLHRLNPITKVVLFMAIVLFGMFTSTPNYPWVLNFAVFVVLLLISAIGGVPLMREIRLRGGYVFAIVTIVLIGNLVFGRGGEGGGAYSVKPQVYFSIPPFIYVSSVSLNFALEKTFFILYSVLAVLLLLKTTRLADLTHAAQSMGVPYPLAVLGSTSMRCIPMVTDGLLIVYNAQRARGMEMDKGGAVARVKQLGGLLGPLILLLLKWVDLMSLVFQSRGLDFTQRHRTRLRVIPLTIVDGVIITALTLGLATFIALTLSGVWVFRVQ